MFSKPDYIVIGKFSEVNFDDLIIETKEGFTIDNKKLKILITTAISIIILGTVADVGLAAGVHDAFLGHGQPAITAMAQVVNHKPTQLAHILAYINWLINLLRLIVSSVAGLIMTFAGYKWATTIDGNGAETAKKILKNAFVGGLIVFAGTTIADFFVGKMEQILAG